MSMSATVCSGHSGPSPFKVTFTQQTHGSGLDTYLSITEQITIFL